MHFVEKERVSQDGCALCGSPPSWNTSRDAKYTELRIINFRPGFYRAMLVDRSPMLGVNEHMGLKLFGREIIFEEFQRI